MIKCKCGKILTEDGWDELYIEDGYLCMKGIANCECGKSYEYENIYTVDFDKPYDTFLDEL